MPEAPPHVVVLGAGFAGVGALSSLQKAPASVTLVDRNDYHTFHPLLYQVATHQLAPEHISTSIESLGSRERIAFVRGQVTGIDLDARSVAIAGERALAYDYLLIALGGVVNFFGTRGAVEHSYPLYNMDDAIRLRSRIVECLDLAARDPSQIDDGVLHFGVVGGGATGVEVAGALVELLRDELAGSERASLNAGCEVHLFEMQPELLTSFKPNLREHARQALERRGVHLHLGEGVSEVTPSRIHLQSGGVVKAHTVVWAAGLQGNPVAASLGAPRPVVEPDLSLAGYPEVFLAGDLATIHDAKTGERLPALGSVAQQSGQRAGDNIGRAVAGKTTRAFDYTDKGTMAMVARGEAIVQLRSGRTLTGKPAWLAWKGLHLMLLKGGEQKARTLLEWGGGRNSVVRD